MSLAVAIQMDPVEAIDIDADSTFVLALEARRRPGLDAMLKDAERAESDIPENCRMESAQLPAKLLPCSSIRLARSSATLS